MSNFLKATNLNVRYGNVAALRGVDFHVDQGEIVTLIGPKRGRKDLHADGHQQSD